MLIILHFRKRHGNCYCVVNANPNRFPIRTRERSMVDMIHEPCFRTKGQRWEYVRRMVCEEGQVLGSRHGWLTSRCMEGIVFHCFDDWLGLVIELHCWMVACLVASKVESLRSLNKLWELFAGSMCHLWELFAGSMCHSLWKDNGEQSASSTSGHQTILQATMVAYSKKRYG